MKSPSPRQTRWAVYLQQFTIKWQYEPGIKNVVADFLSRPQEKQEACVAAIRFEQSFNPLWQAALDSYDPRSEQGELQSLVIHCHEGL